MIELAIGFTRFSVGFLLLAAPLFWMAKSRNRPDLIRTYVIAALVMGLVTALVMFASDYQEALCEEANGRDCIDPGGPGMAALFLSLFGIVAWTKAYFVYKD